MDGATENYSYDAAGKLLSAASSAGEKSYSYDGAGNVTGVSTGAGTTSLSWDSGNRLVGITYPSGGTNAFVYNGLDQRVGKADSSGAFSYTLEDDRIDSAVLADGAASYNHGLGLVSENRGGTSTFYHADALGTTRALSDGSQGVTDTLSTDAFGNKFSAASGGTTPTPFGFAGQHGYQSDVDSGLMRLGHRYYDASVGRFLSRDPIQAGYNWYTYCDNDPVQKVDPEGLNPPLQTPLAPPNANLGRNIREAEGRRRKEEDIADRGFNPLPQILSDYIWFKDQVRNGGPWDFNGAKNEKPQYEDFGNFNYGATGAAMGIPLGVLEPLAGWAQWMDGTSQPSWGFPFGTAPYGDDPKDQHWIRMGYRYYHEAWKPL